MAIQLIRFKQVLEPDRAALGILHFAEVFFNRGARCDFLDFCSAHGKDIGIGGIAFLNGDDERSAFRPGGFVRDNLDLDHVIGRLAGNRFCVCAGRQQHGHGSHQTKELLHGISPFALGVWVLCLL